MYLPICKIKKYGNAIVFDGPSAVSSDIQTQIEEDKKYGVMTPRNGKYFTVKIYDVLDKEISYNQVVKGVMLAWFQAEIEVNIDVRLAEEDEEPDFKVKFRRTADDPNLTKNTIMYHYFPINDFDHPLRGLCVVNSDFWYTIDGEPVPMHVIDPENYNEDHKAKGESIDFDQVYAHEGPGHGLGLPHSKKRNRLMSDNYVYMEEFMHKEPDHETILRLAAKYGRRNMISRWRERWRTWYRVRSEKY